MSRAAFPSRFLAFVVATGLLLLVSPTIAAGQQSLQFDGVNDYVTFGAAPTLGSTTFTIEVAFKRTAAGVTTSTGTGGVTAVPLITKGRGEADGANTDMNWFLGINAANQLTADYEEGAGQASPGLNHPITGATVITSNVWHHAAAVFDGTTWSLYLDGDLDATLVVGSGRLPRFDSIQHAAIGSALTSAGAAAGFFAGLLDEARVWNVARTQAQIQAGIGTEILQGAGLLGRWGLNEGAGTGAGNSVASGVNGTLTNGPLWSADSSLPLTTAAGVRLGGANAYVALGNPASLQLTAFTIELWIRRDGPGVGTNTGSGGIPDAIPLVAKGRAEAESATQDINYLVGIRASDGVLCGDFEEGAGGAAPSLNHPAAGVTPITTGVWHHVAATYDGSAWKLYLDGSLEASLAVGRPLASASVSPVAIGSALTSVGVAAGFFDGVVDEVRIWNVARTQAEIIGSANVEIPGQAPGLVARWGMNEDQGVVVASTAGATLNGTLTGTAWGWAPGSPFNAVTPTAPADPTSLTATAISPTRIDLSWTDNASNETNYQVDRSTSGPGGPFAPLVTLPANSTSTSDTGLSAATEYCYRVRAVNGVGSSGDAAACATTQSVPPPTDPTNLTAVAASPAEIDLAWTDNATDETAYEVERSTTGSGGPFALLITLPANTMSYAHTGLTASTEVCYRVRAVNGALASGYAPVACATTLPAPAAPTGLTASAITSGQIHLGWTDNATDETGYAVERSTSGAGGPFTETATLPANAASWDDLNREAGTPYCYRVRALGAFVPSDYAAVACATTPPAVPGSLDLAGSTYVTFGDPNALDLAAFTLECWFRRDGAGTTTTTGSGGIAAAIPLVTHGAPEADNSNVDMNYFLGLRSDGVLCADFEEGPGGPSPGLNHPVVGTTPMPAGSGWHHAAATYDGTTWNLYLDGNLEATLAVGRPVRSNSIQRAALGTALTSTGATNGFFDGAIDEARVWSVARTQAEIRATANAQLAAAQAGLAARWSLDEGAGTVVNSSAGTEVPGTITGPSYSWSGPAPFNLFTYTITASAGPGGSISPSGDVSVNSGADQAYTIAADPGYHVADVLVDGVSVGAVTTYTFAAVTATHTIAATFAANGDALALSGTDGYVAFGNPPELKLNAFTVEMWLKRDGTGVGTNTGSGGIGDLVPLLAKGRADVEDPLRDINYIVGVQASTGFLAADFEEAAAPSPNPSLNHPVIGTTPLVIGAWYHVAATYDGTTWRLYVNGALDAQLAVGRAVASTSDAPVTLGTAMTSAVPAAGFFQGVCDEVRVWNVARTQAEIIGTINDRIAAPAAGLVARWGLDEGSGTLVQSTAGTPLNGTVTGTGWNWAAGAPFNLAPSNPPAAPANFTAEGVSSSRIDLTWTDASDNETGFEVERSTTGSGGPFTLLAAVGANTTTYSNTGLAPAMEYCYRIRAVNASGPSGYDGPVCTTTEAALAYALSFTGTTYVNLGDPATLDLPQFTIETWFRRDGAGTIVSTGSGGVTDAIPLVTHGTSEADASNVDENFFLGIKSAGAVLCADFEEGAGGASPGLNHPIVGVTPIVDGVWYHAAATYDGTTWKLYLNGNLEGQLAVGQPVQSASIQLAALASSVRSNGTAQGFFVGALDEARIWNTARTQAQIQGAINAQIAVPTPGLVARWALDEGAGTAVNGTAGTTVNGTISGTGYAWVAGAPFNLAFNLPPGAPALVAPADQSTELGLTPTLQVSATDPDGQSLTFQFYGRAAVATPGSDFTIVGMPDTQYYTGELNGGTNAILLSQTNWITANRASRHIGYVATLGDCVEHGDNGGSDIEWQHADAGYSLIENPLTTGLPEGLPYGITVGNHDQSPNGNPDGATTVFYNQYFGVNRFAGRSYYGGHYGTNNDNWYNLFSAGGMDFVVISLEYDTTPDAAILDWADGLLTTYSDRRAIVLSHNFIGTGNPGAWSAQGQATYDRLKTHPNLFLMLCGHVPGEGRRVDTFNGNTITTVMSDYQGRTNGGNGWLRIMDFSPSNNVIHVRTYSPWLDQFETDADSQFDIPYTMSGAAPFALLGSVSEVASGGVASLTLDGLTGGTPYQWYVIVSDGVASVTSPTWGFTTHSVTGVEEQPVTAFSMRMTSSNPTSSGASLAFELPRPGRVRVQLFDAAGRLVAKLADAVYPSGRHALGWTGQNGERPAPSGVYFVRFEAPGRQIVRRFVLVR